MPLNKYSSVVETMRARDVMELTISPPNDLECARTGDGWRILNVTDRVNPEGNIILHRVGLFCNFADGLVIKNAHAGPVLEIRVRGYNDISGTPAGTISMTTDSKTVTGTGTNFTSFGLSFDMLVNTNFNNLHYLVDSVGSATSLTLDSYPLVSQTVGQWKPMNRTGLFTELAYDYINVRELNYMYDTSVLFNPLEGGSLDAPDYLAIEGRVLLPLDSSSDAPFYLTKSINTDYDGDTAAFDILADIEFTPQ